MESKREVNVAYVFRGERYEKGSVVNTFVEETRAILRDRLGSGFGIFGANDAVLLQGKISERPKARKTLLAIEAPHTHYNLGTQKLIGWARDSLQNVSSFVFLSDQAHAFPAKSPNLGPRNPEGFRNVEADLKNLVVAYGVFPNKDMELVLPLWFEFLNRELDEILVD